MFDLRGAVELRPFRFNRMDEFRQRETNPPRFHHKLHHFMCEKTLAISGARRGKLRHHGAEAGSGFQITFLNQVLDCLMRGVGMDFQLRGERTDRRKWLSGREFTTDEGLLRGEHDLIEDGVARAQAEP